MKTQSMLLAALASAPAAFAHTAFTDFYVDGVPQVRFQWSHQDMAVTDSL